MTIKRTFAWLLTLPAFAAGSFLLPANVRADATPVYREGTAASEIVVTEENCPIEVAREVLTFRVSEFPDPEKGASDYGASLTAEYTLYNPTAADRETVVYVPCGRAEYFADACQTEPCAITVEGETITPEVRYTYRGAAFDPTADALHISDEKRTSGLLAEDTVVSVRTYSFTGTGEDGCDYLHLVLHCNPAKTRVIFGGPVKTGIKEGLIHAVWKPEEPGECMQVYSVGVPAREVDFYATQTMAGSRSALEPAWTIADSEITLGALVESERAADGEIGEVDWFNGYLDMLESAHSYGLSTLPFGFLSARCFVRWCRYSCTVPAEGNAVTSVVTPLYPTVNGTSYRYGYNLSPAAHWAAFHSIEINIETPYRLSSTWTFAEREGGYSLSQDYLPLGELTFTLTDGDLSSQPPFIPYLYGLTTLEIALIVLGGAAVAPLVTLVVLLIVRRQRKKRAEGTVGRGETTQGTLPPSDDEE